jgi:hypothetical protein
MPRRRQIIVADIADIRAALDRIALAVAQMRK